VLRKQSDKTEKFPGSLEQTRLDDDKLSQTTELQQKEGLAWQ